MNLNRTDNQLPIYTKAHSPNYWVIKELRLFGKIPVLRSAFPNAHFVSIIRHPCATVQSILAMIEQGYLKELRRDLNTFFEKLEIQCTAQKYKNLINKFRYSNMAQRLALYWRISNEIMYHELIDCPTANNLVYEQLSQNPLTSIENLFAHIGLKVSTSTREYINFSSKSSKTKPTPISTIRDSANYYSSWKRTIDKTTRQSVLEVTKGSDLMSRFNSYYDE
jgi:hypothetical protein